MRSICLEIRDSMTFIPVMAVSTESYDPEKDRTGHTITQPILQRMMARNYLLRRSGYPSDGSIVIVINLNNTRSTNSPYDWRSSRTMQVAHEYIEKNFYDLSEGDVIDVEFILGETAVKKISERFET